MITTYIIPAKMTDQVPVKVGWVELCEEIEPKPLYCEIPEDLKLKFTTMGTSQQYIYSVTVSGTSVYPATLSVNVHDNIKVVG